LNVGHIITRPLISIASIASILDAAKIMVYQNLGLLVVCDVKEKVKLVGVVSERDIIRAVVSGKRMDAPVHEICTKTVVTVKADSDVAEAAKAMNRNRIRHVVIVDDHETPIGVVSMRDLVGERSTLTAILQSHEKEVFIGGD